jgi:Raf kinase inhibitor-like YbhB/YbcL family protein
MLQYLPHMLGEALRGRRPGTSRLAIHRPEAAEAPRSIALLSPAFADGAELPRRYTADGEGLSPPLVWRGVPDETLHLVLMIEDADSPTAEPLVHAIVPDVPLRRVDLEEGELNGGAIRLGRNSYLRASYLPPDPPPGHGPHRYAFELFALARAPALGDTPGRREMLKMMLGRVLAKGCLTGVYGRV